MGSSTILLGRTSLLGRISLLGRTSKQVIYVSELQLAHLSNRVWQLSVLKVEKHQGPSGLSSVDPLPSSPAQEALDLLFSCDSTEEASGSPARGPLSEAELALFDPYSKEGKEQVLGSGTKGCEGRPSVAVRSSGRSRGGWS